MYAQKIWTKVQRNVNKRGAKRCKRAGNWHTHMDTLLMRENVAKQWENAFGMCSALYAVAVDKAANFILARDQWARVKSLYSAFASTSALNGDSCTTRTVRRLQ